MTPSGESNLRFAIRRADGAYYLGRDLEGEWWQVDGPEKSAAYWPSREAAEVGLLAYKDRELKSGVAPRVEAEVIQLSWCEPCGKYESEHGTCEKCGHSTPCDCICEFLRTDWPTHPANPDRVADAIS